jgi:hypothetical protein
MALLIEFLVYLGQVGFHQIQNLMGYRPQYSLTSCPICSPARQRNLPASTWPHKKRRPIKPCRSVTLQLGG